MNIKITKELVEIFAYWTKAKIHIHASEIKNFPRERQVWWASLGQNIGVEINGKNQTFERPVLVVKRYNDQFSLIVPISSKIKDGKYYLPFTNPRGDQNVVVLSQLRAISNKRFIRKIGKIDSVDYKNVKARLRDLI